MNTSWEVTQLLKHEEIRAGLSDNQLQSLQQVTDKEYFDAIANLALNPKCTPLIFAYHEDIFVEICSRWVLLSQSSKNPFLVLDALAKVLPLAPHLSTFVRIILQSQNAEISQAFTLNRVLRLEGDSDRSIHYDLLTILRVLSFDNEEFSALVLPAPIQLLFGQPHRPTQYLAIRVLCLYLRTSDAVVEKLIKDHLGVDTEIDGLWEDISIDYFFLDLWESRRLENLRQQVIEVCASRKANMGRSKAISAVKAEDLSPTTARLGDVLVPRYQQTSSGVSQIVSSQTTRRNLNQLASAYLKSNNILVAGPSGAGKTALVHEISRELGRDTSMITLHLNEQTDLKSLIGVYTGDNSQGSFSWCPGVLTTAVTEGRWVLVEDLDRAPPDIISTLLPLMERRELLVPNWSKSIRAAPGFRLIATLRSSFDRNGDQKISNANIASMQHWTAVQMLIPPDQELAEILAHRYPLLVSYVGQIMKVYSCLRDFGYRKGTGKLTMLELSKPYGPRDLFKWCRRLQALFLKAGVRKGNEPISEAANDSILLETVDCFAGFLPLMPIKSTIVEIVAKKLHFPPERIAFCLETRRPEYSHTALHIRFGRASLLRRSSRLDERMSSDTVGKTPFALNDHTLRLLESISVAVEMAEPCLLVGETGTGKTAIIQKLAELMGTKLIVVNLSQQSEAGDLLGGYKPMNMRTLAVPIFEEFEDLFSFTFSSKRNQHFIDTVSKAISKGRWTRVLALWQEALQMVEASFGFKDGTTMQTAINHQSKKRRLNTPKLQNFKTRWKTFDSNVQTFKMHLASGSKGFAFSFIEGNIVKAARNGQWVLLDEINLASSDALDSIADLLSQGGGEAPSLLLPETGKAEQVRAHKDFRLFAAMNPATDIGKRDLSAGFRSRFTEIFVEPPDTNLDNVISIVKTYLASHSHMEIRVSLDIAQAYLEIKTLAEANLLVDGSNQKPHFSLRTLTRTLIYVQDIAHIYGLRRALYEGFCMSFLTLLSAEAAALVLPIIEKNLLGPRKNTQAFLNQIPRPPECKDAYIRFKHYWMPQGPLPIEQQPDFIITPFIERNLLNLVRATMTRRFPVLLQGPTSSGKTRMIEYLAKISGNRYLRINNHEHTDLQEYLGTYISGSAGSLQFKDGVLVRALREGSWIVLDELNLAPTDVLEALNRLLDDNRELLIPETQQIVRPHANFMLFATQNPPGMYGGRKMLSRAFRNRFLELHFDDIPEEELETILRERCTIPPSFCTRIVTVYKRLSILRQTARLFEQRNSFATLRDLFRWALRDADDREQLAINGFLLLAERVRNLDERKEVKQIIEDVMKVSINEDLIYSKLKVPQKGSATRPLNEGVVWTRSMRRLYVLIAEAFKKNEPVLLVGETGSGKTRICQLMAELMKTHLHIVNAHENMETGDLIGSYRPIRNKDTANSQLIRELAQVLNVSVDDEDAPSDILPTLLRTYDTLGDPQKEKISREMRLDVEAKRISSTALFEWMDGSLVHAMKAGEHFLLDEISLADDSVLERLNSVLEPGRTLFLAEKGTDGAPIIAASGFRFCATMNPGGDYGKKELSPALRNRFTEIWVPGLDDKAELIEITRDKLQERWTDFTEPIVAFGDWFNSRCIPITPSSSIRDLLAWVAFLNTTHITDDYLAILHGAATVYIDSLGADPAAKLSISADAISAERHACLTRLGNIFRHDMVSIYNAEYALSVGPKDLAIGPFKLSISHGNWQDPEYSLEAPTTKANVLRIVRALQLPRPILLEGSPGVGKTTLIATLAAAVGVPLTRINLSDQTDLMDLFGSDVPLEGEEPGIFGWRQAPFLRAMQNGEWVLLDEMNLASQSVLEGLNACLDHRGQVYVPELDQTFSRHPKFVIFAAQNPHSQGGGRKGLPSSFVNRFTVVCIDEFTTKDQLMICRKAFPLCPDQVLQSVSNCTTVVNKFIRDNPAIGYQGGPWEFNLRDSFRWLHLITRQHTRLLAKSAIDFQDLMILQRLRTTDDIVAVSRLLQSIMQYANRPHDYFSLLGSSFLQVGVGLLPKSTALSRSAPQQHFGKPPNRRYLESMMLCVENNWPCLLVGSSGSGKTYAITQLASILGAEITTIPLNTDMDTVDLIGGYGQADPQRNLTDFLKHLKKCLKELIIERLLLGAPEGDYLNPLDDQLQLESPELPRLISNLRVCAEKVRVPEFANAADNLDRILQQSSEENRGRFEWVDGILVKALQEGSWLILDHANLCNPSVLDRLNSLLEPNGSLIINERRSSDGSAPVIKPHPSFRIFMTADPRHGELSRAMRNRSVELHFPAPTLLETTVELGGVFTPSLARFQIFTNLDWASLADALFIELAAIYFDHLAFSDWPLRNRWIEQVNHGLLQLTTHQLSLFSYVTKLYDRMASTHPTLFSTIQGRYKKLTKLLTMDAGWRDYAMTQTLHPMNNGPLVNVNDKDDSSPNLRWLGTIFDVTLTLCKFEDRLESLQEAAKRKLAGSMTLLEKSFAASQPGTTIATLPMLIGALLRDMAQAVRRSLSEDNIGNDEQKKVGSIEKLLTYLNDFADVVEEPRFDGGIFQTYQSLGKLLAYNLIGVDHLHDVGITLIRRLEEFDDSWRLSCGQSMERLWTFFDPATARNLPELDTRLQVEALSDRFDKVKWSFNGAIEELGVLRNSIVCTPDSIINSPNFTQSLQDMQNAFDDIEKAERVADHTWRPPYFRAEFEGLRQYRDIMEAFNSKRPDTMLELLACRPAKKSMTFGSPSHAYRLLTRLEDSTGIARPKNALFPARGTLALSALQKIDRLSEFPLRSLDLLRKEVDVLANRTACLANSLSCDHQRTFDGLLSSMYAMVLSAHDNFPSSPALSEAIEHVKDSMNQHLSLESLHKVSLSISKTESADLEYFRNVNSRYFLPSLECLHKAQQQREDGRTSHIPANSALAWIFLSIGCLLLYVPDRPFDPASKPLVGREQHRKRKSELQIKLEAQSMFEQAFTGETSNLRYQELQRKLQDFGDEPQVREIARPLKSNIAALQAVFNSLLVSVIRKIPPLELLEHFCQGDPGLKPELELLRSNIARHVSRLNENEFRTYDDITKPLIGLLQGLDFGLALLMVAQTMTNSQQAGSCSVYDSVAFLGMLPDQPANRSFKEMGNNDLESRYVYLRMSTIARTIAEGSEDCIAPSVLEVYHTFYADWKQRLSESQRENATRSSLYQYRGWNGDLEKSSIGSGDVFPDENIITAHQHKSISSDPRIISQTLARIQRQMFKNTESASQQILRMLTEAAHQLSDMSENTEEVASFTLRTEKLLPALIISLDESRALIGNLSTDMRQYNFYTDANLSEVQKLLTLLQGIHQRFIDLKIVWPDHATIGDVLRTSNELLETRFTAPVAQLLTKTEQLHGYIFEWQVVASRKYSTAALYDQLTNLLVSWRHLELSTWARLLEIEDERCVEDVDAWWFIAYEVIIAAPLSIIDSGQELGAHTEQLLDTLALFLRTTSIGHYTLRLRSIECFLSHVEVLGREVRLMQPIGNALRNILGFHWRFQPAVQDLIQAGRLALEKEMKEVLLLASWKDTNINALRDSANRSHHKLFKVIRKYRALLAQPAQTVFERGLLEGSKTIHPVPCLKLDTRVSAVDVAALRICEEILPGWAAKPSRLKNPIATAAKIMEMTMIPASGVDSAMYLGEYVSLLVESMKTLQRETPTLATKENVSTVKYLKARKRKLFADTLKDLRQMGFKQNMNESALMKQASLSRVLTDTPALSKFSPGIEIEAAESYFHRFLELMPRIKADAREHSDDLSQAEISRSVSYLESMLSVILRQRDNLGISLTGQEQLAQTIDLMQSLWTAGNHGLRQLHTDVSCRSKIVIDRLRWLQALVETGSTLLEKHGKLGDIDNSAVIHELASWKQKIDALLDSHKSLRRLPEYLSCSIHDQIYGEAEGILGRLRGELEALSKTHPKTAFVLSHIRPWTEIALENGEYHNDTAAVDLMAFDAQISQTVDSILVAVQRVNLAMADVPNSTKDPTWLIQVDKLLSEALKRFNTTDVAQSLSRVIGDVRHIQITEGWELKAAAASMAIALPIIQQFLNSQQRILHRFLNSHTDLCKLALVLAQSLSQLISQGFCSPAESASSDGGKTEKLEGGTGLGEGEGAEDISRDIQDDEDLSELAQEGTRNQDGEELENEDDAVDMDHDELEGEAGDASGSEEEGASGDEKDNEALDEEIGNVDDLNASAIDEKLWEAEKEESKGTSKAQNTGEMADTADNDGGEAREGGAEEEAASKEETAGAEEVVKEEAEKLEPHRQDKGPLDLPEEMNIDLDDHSTVSDLRESEEGGDLESDEDHGDEKLDTDPTGGEDLEEEDVSAMQQTSNMQEEQDDDATKESDAGSPVDTEPEDNGSDDDLGFLKRQTNDAVTGVNDPVSSEAQGGGQDDLNQSDHNDPQGQAGTQSTQGGKPNNLDNNGGQAAAEEGDPGQPVSKLEDGSGNEPPMNENTSAQAFKKLGDALEKWHRQQQQIREATSENAQPRALQDEMTDQTFEHLQNENSEADAQALGAATEEQAHTLDPQAMDTEMGELNDDFFPDELAPRFLGDEENPEDPLALEAPSAHDSEQPRPSAFIGLNHTRDPEIQHLNLSDSQDEDEHMSEVGETSSPPKLPSTTTASARSLTSARRLWQHYETHIHPLSLILTEQLRLILTPTQATKMRGDFRTGKRLNIKRIIPYIASNYKRDKIWMRRSVPQRRNYQIMLAVDDSKSMGESGSGQLALEALVLVSKSLSMLEVGEICVVGFGDDVKVVHEFDKPFSADAGINILQQLGFRQTKTNVRKLVEESITLFREAKAKAPSSSSSTEIWQLLLIMSDGLCEEHDEIRRLVRQAQEEKIMIVFVIVDGVKGESIVNMSQAVFEDHPAGSGEQKLKIKRYLEDFPFMYYLVVGDVKELPGVLATALRQWFSEVVGQG